MSRTIALREAKKQLDRKEEQELYRRFLELELRHRALPEDVRIIYPWPKETMQ